MRRPLRPITTRKDHLLDSEDAFTFAVSGESRPTLPRFGWSAVTLQIMRELELIRPAFVLFTGDAIWGYNDTQQELANELDRFRALCDSTGVPFYNVPGNHEMQSEKEAIALLRKKGYSLYGSFEVGRYHFVALNTDEWWKEGRVSGRQLAWLRADLAVHRDSAGIFVFMHRPIFSRFQGDFNPDDADVLLELFRTHPVRAVFASHDHFYYERRRDGIRYITAGGGGAPAYAQPPRGGFSHYVLVTVTPRKVTYNVVEPFRLQVETIRGNDGVQPASTVSVANTTDRDLLLRNVRMRAPRLGNYHLSVDFEDYTRQAQKGQAAIGDIADTNDGSVTVRIETLVPAGNAFFLTLEASE